MAQFFPEWRVFFSSNYRDYIMKKDCIISFRLPTKTRDALKLEAAREHRSMSSLLELVIDEYLNRSGNTKKGGERRRHPRRNFHSPALVETEFEPERKCYLAGTVQDISLTGLRISFPYGEPVSFLRERRDGTFDIVLRIPGSQRPINFSCSVKRVEDTGHDYQVGAMISNAEFHSYQALQNYIM